MDENERALSAAHLRDFLYTSPSLAVKSCDNECGLFVTAAVKASTVLVKVPADYMLVSNSSGGLNEARGLGPTAARDAQALAGLADLPHVAQLGLALLLLKGNAAEANGYASSSSDDSQESSSAFWTAYCATLPETAPPTPLLWSAPERTALRGSWLTLEVLCAQWRQVRAEFDRLAATARGGAALDARTAAALATVVDGGFDAYASARALAASRNFRVFGFGSAAADQEGQALVRGVAVLLMLLRPLRPLHHRRQ